MLSQELREYEAKTVVTSQGETIAMLRKAFDSVCDKKHWKNPFYAVVSKDEIGIVCRAVEFYHADKPTVVEYTENTVIVVGKGYQA